MRPRPPDQLLSSAQDADRPLHIRFLPAPDLAEWLMATFIEESGPLANPDHAHLQFARIGVLWTNVSNSRGGRSIVGQAEFLKNAGGAMGKWPRARAEQQITEWFGEYPDFLLTFDAGYAAACSDAEFCALVEHELYHCGQETDEFGAPKFSQSGLPVFRLRAHDVEEFTGIVRRYGADAAHVRELVDAASRPPEVASVSIKAACGNCVMPRIVRS